MPVLTQIGTGGLKNNAVTSAKIGVDVIVADDIANNAITVAELANGAVTPVKLNGIAGNGTAGQALTTDGDGTFSFTTITSDLVDDTTPQLGGDLDVNGNNINFGDNEKAQFGASNDLQIFHDGSNSNIKDAGTGNLKLLASNFALQNSAANHNAITYTDGGAVSLFHNNSKKLETSAAGAIVTGNLYADGVILGDSEEIQFGASTDMRIYHSGTNSIIRDVGTGDLYVGGDNLRLSNGSLSAFYARGYNGGKFELFFNNSATFETTADGGDFMTTGALKVPVGTTAQRPSSPTNGDIRYNTTDSKFEVYEGGVWSQYSVSYGIDALVIAGGGGGASGGGGAGGTTNYTNESVTAGTAYAVTVGGGGSSGTGNTSGSNGGTSSLGGISGSNVGGGGAGHFSNSSANNGNSGGSGGGAGGSDSGLYAGVGGSGTAGQGNSGGNGVALNTFQGRGGGGGKGGAGGNASGQSGGAGGTGYTWSDGVTRASGGAGGGSASVPATAGGGGASGGSSQAGQAATANTGGGGGGGGNQTLTSGGNGGSGVVIIRYAGSTRGSGGTITSSGGYTYHTFTSSGTFTA